MVKKKDYQNNIHYGHNTCQHSSGDDILNQCEEHAVGSDIYPSPINFSHVLATSTWDYTPFNPWPAPVQQGRHYGCDANVDEGSCRVGENETPLSFE